MTPDRTPTERAVHSLLDLLAERAFVARHPDADQRHLAALAADWQARPAGVRAEAVVTVRAMLAEFDPPAPPMTEAERIARWVDE